MRRPSNVWSPAALVRVCDLATTGALRLTLTPVAARAQTLVLLLVEGRAAWRAAMEKAEVAAMAIAISNWQQGDQSVCGVAGRSEGRRPPQRHYAVDNLEQSRREERRQERSEGHKP